VLIGVSIFIVGFIYTFPYKPIVVIDWSNPTVIDDFQNTTLWYFGSAEEVKKGQYGISKGYMWLKCNSTELESVAYKREVSIDTNKYPYLAIEFSTTQNAALRLSIQTSRGAIRQILSAPNQVAKTTEKIDIKEYTNSTITTLWLYLNDYPASISEGEVGAYIGRILAYRRIVSASWDDFLIVGFLSALVLPSATYYFDSRRKDSIDSNLPNLLRDIAEAGRTGMTLTRAVEVNAERDYGPLTEELRKTVAQLTWKVPLETALQSFSDRCDTPLARRTTLLILEASRAGGDIQESIDSVNRHIEELQSIERRRKTQMRPYIALIYISFFVFLVTVFIIVTQFFVSVSSVGGLGFLGAKPVPVETYSQIFLYMAIVEAIFGGLAGGKMSSGSLKHGFKHVLVLSVISFIVFNFFV
jgi:flagellar protein FlaJ